LFPPYLVMKLLQLKLLQQQ